MHQVLKPSLRGDARQLEVYPTFKSSLGRIHLLISSGHLSVHTNIIDAATGRDSSDAHVGGSMSQVPICQKIYRNNKTMLLLIAICSSRAIANHSHRMQLVGVC